MKIYGVGCEGVGRTVVVLGPDSVDGVVEPDELDGAVDGCRDKDAVCCHKEGDDLAVTLFVR